MEAERKSLASALRAEIESDPSDSLRHTETEVHDHVPNATGKYSRIGYG